MAGFRNRTGERIGRLTVLCEAATRTPQGRVKWHCKCDCGNEIVVSGGDLYSNRTTSCGCLQSERTASANAKRAKHGHARHLKSEPVQYTGEYNSWRNMIGRCKYPTAANYHLYGGRGITVCDRWKGPDGFINFIKDMGQKPDRSFTIDRIDTDGNYEPSNCRWASKTKQAANRRTTEEYAATQRANLDRGRERMWSDPEIRARLIAARRRKKAPNA